jgi:hypothetical protein
MTTNVAKAVREKYAPILQHTCYCIDAPCGAITKGGYEYNDEHTS